MGAHPPEECHAFDEGKGWLRSNWRPAVVLVLIFGLALFLRVYFVYGIGFVLPGGPCDAIYTPTYTGGSDSYYWDRALCYSYQTGQDLGRDPMLNYPIGFQNPRPPLFPWFSLLVGRILSPLFATGWQAVVFTFLLSTGLFGALTVFPTYALGKEAFGRKPGIIAALLLAISVGHLQRSAATDTDHDAFTLFFVVTTFYFYLRALRTLTRRRWVENWFVRKAITSGVRGFLKENRTPVLYALLAGLCVGVIALSWQGWAYVAVILMVWFAVELFLDRFRNEDTLGAWLLFSIALGTPLLIALPWYVERGYIRVWYDAPAYLYLAAVVFGLAFTVTRDYPWTLVIPSTLVAAVAGLGIGIVVNPTLTGAFITGAGYFVQTKVVTTIAEDQSPGMSQMILAFGLFTFGLGFLSILYLVYQIPRRRDPAYNLIVVWAVAAVFMAITAARFIFNASPAFALLSGFAVDQILVRADFATMRRTYRSLATGSWRNALRKSVKVRHVLAVLGLVFLVLLPNVWWAVDASIPFDLKAQYDRQIANLLPSFLRSPSATQSPFYLGAFGYNVPKSSEYYPAAWEWFAKQDADRPRELRPAFLSWWDYGFEAVDRGAHPTVADNFQDGFALAGQFITAQNETEAIALLAIRLLEGDIRARRTTFSPLVQTILEQTGLSPDLFRSVFLRPGDFIAAVLSDPVRFGAWASDMQPLNAMYIFLLHFITERLDEGGVVALYHALRAATGWEIGYFAVDSRLFPISVQNTGIFYAPVKLSDHRILQLSDGRVLPVDFFQILVTTSLHGSKTPIQLIGPGERITTQEIAYRPAFYNSMFYRSYIGYSPTDIGSPNATDIPGVPGSSLVSTPPVPAWNLTHFRVVYRTAYYNPFPDPGNHTDAWRAVNYDDAQRLQANITAGTIKAVVDLDPRRSVENGVVFLRYYDGALVNGTLSAGSSPLPGVRITVTDELGTPHDVTTTDAAGRYSALVPFGDVTITASVGTVTRTTLIGSRTLATTKVHVTVDQAMRSPADLDADGRPDWILSRDLQTEVRELHGTAYYDLNRDAAFDAADLRVPGAVISLSNKEFGYRRTATADLDGTFSIQDLPPAPFSVSVGLNGRTLAAAEVTPNPVAGAAQDVAVPFSIVRGKAISAGGEAVAGATVDFLDETNGTDIATVAQANGSFRAGPLLAGNYTITAASGDLVSLPTQVHVSTADMHLNLTLSPSGTVAGTTSLFGNPRPFATLAFQSAAEPQTIRTIASDAAARFSIRLAAGDWFVNGRFYDSTTLYATLGRVTVAAGTTTPFTANFVVGVRVNGTVRDPTPGGSGPQASVAFSSAAGELWVRTDSQGGYLAFLPSGTYDVEAFNREASFFGALSFGASGRTDIALAPSSQTVPWRAYRDANGNGVADPGEDIAGARVDLRDGLGAHVFLTTPPSGNLTIPLNANRTYAGSVSAAGFAAHQIPPSTPATLQGTVPIPLTPLRVSIQGTVLLDGGALVNHPVGIAFVPVGGGGVAASATSDSNGGYSVGLVPGTYDLVVDENVSTSRDSRYQNLGSDRVVLRVGQAGLSYDVRIVLRNRIQGDVRLSGSRVPATLRFDGPERRAANATATGYEIYLLPGTYAVTANRTEGSIDYAFVSSATVPSAGNVSFVFAAATRVSGRVLFNGASVPGPMPLSFVRQAGGRFDLSTGATGTYETILPPGSYAVTLSGSSSATEGGIVRFYRYDFRGNLSIPTNQATLAYDLATSRSLDNTTVSGTVTMAGVGTTATVTFTARGGGAITAQAAADSTGAYSVALAAGTYDVYAVGSTESGAFLRRIAIPHAPATARDFGLVAAFVLSGRTTDANGIPVSGALTIQSSAEIDLPTDSSGAFRAVLPADAYTVAATRIAPERGIPVTYRATTSVSLQADASITLPLEKVVAHNAILTWDASERRTVPAGGSVSYTITVRNAGNVPETLTFSGSPSGWEFSFSPASLSLDWGNAAPSGTLRVAIQTPAGALVDHGNIQISAISGTDSSTIGTVTVQVDIERVRSLSATIDAASPVFDGRHLDYAIVVKNAGNAKETVDVLVANPDDLAGAGWTVQLGTAGGPLDGTTLHNVTVEANQSTRISLRAQSGTGASGVQVIVQVNAPDAPGVSAQTSFGLDYPALSPGQATANGPEITRTAPTDPLFLAVGVGVVAGVAAGVILSRRRR